MDFFQVDGDRGKDHRIHNGGVCIFGVLHNINNTFVGIPKIYLIRLRAHIFRRVSGGDPNTTTESLPESPGWETQKDRETSTSGPLEAGPTPRVSWVPLGVGTESQFLPTFPASRRGSAS